MTWLPRYGDRRPQRRVTHCSQTTAQHHIADVVNLVAEAGMGRFPVRIRSNQGV